MSSTSSEPILAAIKEIGGCQTFEFIISNDLKNVDFKSGALFFITADNISNISNEIFQLIKRRWVLLYDCEYIHEQAFKTFPYNAINVKTNVEQIKGELKGIFNDFKQDYNHIEFPSHKVSLPLFNGDTLSIFPESIKYIEASGDYSDIIIEPELESQKYKYCLNENLKSTMERLVNFQFFRSHKSYAVNLNWLMDEHPYPQDKVHLKDGIKVPLARRRKVEFHNAHRSMTQKHI